MQAIIDIGSNSVRLMLWADGKTLYKRIKTTRLGAGLEKSRSLSPEAIERTVRAVADFAEEGRALGASVHAFATAAVRAAQNRETFLARTKELGIDVDVVSGEEEALLGLCGAMEQGREGGIIDIGGASTEICLCGQGGVAFSVSLEVGAVRLFDRCGEDAGALSAEIERAISPLRGRKAEGRVYVIGGTGSTLASVMLGLEKYDAEKIQDFPMPADEVFALTDKLLSLTAEERRALKGMDAGRADIIAGGALLLSGIIKKLSLAAVYASDRDNLEGYLRLRGLK